MMAMENRPLIDELPIQSGDFHSYSLPEAMSIEDSYPDRFGTYNSSAPRWVGMLQLDRIDLWLEMVGLTLGSPWIWT